MIEDTNKGTEDERERQKFADYYFQTCKWLHEGVFTFEDRYSFDFLEQFGYENVKDLLWISLLNKVIDKALFEEYEQQSSKYRKEESGATFLLPFQGYYGLGCWYFTVEVAKDEDSANIISKFLQRFKYITGIKLDVERLQFADPDLGPLAEEGDIVSYAIKDRVFVGITPRLGHPHEDPWCLDDIVPTILKYVHRDGLYFPLETRFRLWTFIWGTAQTVTRLIKANPTFLEKAQSLGINENVFNDVMDSPIPSSPATEPIPLEVLESTTMLRCLIGFMHDEGLIDNDDGLNLVMDRP